MRIFENVYVHLSRSQQIGLRVKNTFRGSKHFSTRTFLALNNYTYSIVEKLVNGSPTRLFRQKINSNLLRILNRCFEFSREMAASICS